MGTNISIEDIVNEYYEIVYSYIYRMIGNIYDAQDITQNVFIKIKTNLHRYDKNKATIKTWMYKISTNTVINFTKARKDYLIDNIEFIPSTDDVLGDLLEEEQHNIVTSAIVKHLKAKHKKIILLYIFSELTPKEISHSMSIPLKTVYNAIYLSIEKLRRVLEV